MVASQKFTAQVCNSGRSIYICTLFLREAKELNNWSVRLGVRTPDFHSGNTGSIPVQTTNMKYKSLIIRLFVFKGGNLSEYVCELPDYCKRSGNYSK